MLHLGNHRWLYCDISCILDPEGNQIRFFLKNGKIFY
jgi:hypothetical protein